MEIPMKTVRGRHALDPTRPLHAASVALALLVLAQPGLFGQTPEGAAPPAAEPPATAAAPGVDGACCCGGGCGGAAGGSMTGCRHGGPGGMRMGRSRGRGMGPGMASGKPGLMHAAMSLVHQRQGIERTVEEIPGGVRTRTVVAGEDPELVRTLVEHVEGMAGLMAQGGRIRSWDPLFSELFDHAAAIDLEVEEIPGGVLVVETSADPEVAKLIRAHAYKVNEFLARGHGAVHESTPLPEDYRRRGSAESTN